MILYDIFFRRYGSRLSNHLVKPRLFPIAQFEFPKNSIWHYVEYDGLRPGPDTNDYYLRSIQKKIFVEHITELHLPQGNPRKLSIPLMPLVRDFHLRNKRFRLSYDITTNPSEENTLGIVNYCLIPKAYKYPRSIYAEYYKWRNMETTLWKALIDRAGKSSRQHYYFIKLPQTLPSVSRLNYGVDKLSQRLLMLFNTRELLMLLEIWKWMSLAHRRDSVIGEQDQEVLNKINLVFEDSGYWAVFNLGVLNSWRYINGVSDPNQKEKIEPEQLQKRFLRGLMSFMSSRIQEQLHEGEEPQDEVDYEKAGTYVPEDEDSPEDKEDADDDLEYTDSSKKSQPFTINTPQTKPPQASSLTQDSVLNTPIEDDQAILSTHEEYKKILKELDDDLAQLDLIEKEVEELDGAKETLPDTDTEIITDNPNEQEEIKQRQEKKTTKKVFIPNDSAHPDIEVSHQSFDQPKTIVESNKYKLNRLADQGAIDGIEYRRRLKQIEKSQELDSPKAGVKLKDYIVIEKDDLLIERDDAQSKIKDIETVTDKSMLKSNLLSFDKNYVDKVMQKDIASIVSGTQKAGFNLTDYNVERVEDAVSQYEMHTVRIAPLEGAPSTLRFKLPVVNDNGQYMNGGTQYIMRKQRTDLPIRKITSTRVALSSYYGKTFVIRSEKKVNDYAQWLHNQISALSLKDEPLITELHPSNVFDHTFTAPRTYTILAQYFRSFKYKGFEMCFDHQEREKLFSVEHLNAYEKSGSILFGYRTDDTLLMMDKNSIVYEINHGDMKTLGRFEDMFFIERNEGPLEFTEARIFGKNIPVGVILGYKYGLTKLIEMLGAEVRRVGAGQRQNLQEHEYGITFSDETLIFSRDDPVSALILAGFSPYHKTTKNYSVYTFDQTGVYLKLLEQHNMSVRYLREIDLLDDAFVDPITEEILKDMGEPLTYRGLLVRATELLLTDYHRDPLDMQEMRIRGYERFAGAVYTEMINAVRDHRSKINRKNTPIEMNPYAVWQKVLSDPSSLPVNDLNPIQNLKEIESVTYGGTGGRTSRAMTASVRGFHKHDLGIVSEATSDSADVGINTYLSADPLFTSVRGRTEARDVKDIDPVSLVSTSAMISVGANQDSAQRLNMVSIQQGHVIACDGYQASAVRTGYEQVIAHRVGESYARTADMDGKIISIDEEGMTVEYTDGTTKGFTLGRKFGKSSDLIIPHQLVTDHRVGDTFSKGDVLIYNNGFFTRDRLNPKSVVWKNGVNARVVLMETRLTHEDASAISEELADKLLTRTTKIKNIVVTFDQQVRNLLMVGEKVEHDSVLCFIEDNITSQSTLFDEDSLSTLRMLSKQAPTAKVKGVIEKIEVFYRGDIEDMSESLKDIVTRSNRDMRRTAKSQGKRAFTGQVDESFRIRGEELQIDSLAIRVYITSEARQGTGDKVVYANQLKSIVSEVMDYEVKTESGLKIDAVFGAQSVFNRIVNSAFVQSTTNTLMDVIGKKAARIYRG